MGQRLHPGGDEDTELAGLLDGLQVECLHLTDVLPLVLGSDPRQGEVVSLQPQARVLPDDQGPGADQASVLLPDQSARPNIAHLQ